VTEQSGRMVENKRIITMMMMMMMMMMMIVMTMTGFLYRHLQSFGGAQNSRL